MVYRSVLHYVESISSLEEQVATLTRLIDEHRKVLLENVSNSVIERNAWDDGQIRIDTVYRSPTAIMNAIAIMENEKRFKIEQINRQLQGSTIVLRDESSFYR